MTKVRQDAWSHEDDLLLAETVLRHIREGSTQLDAFEEVGDHLNRTGAACGFRWNAIVRKKYEQAVEIAKKQRKEKKRAENPRFQPEDHNTQQPIQPELTDEEEFFAAISHGEQFKNHAAEPVRSPELTVRETNAAADELTLNKVIAFLKSLDKDLKPAGRLEKENGVLKKEKAELESRVEELEKKLAKVNESHATIEEDYQSLIKIMDRARRMVVLQDNEGETPQFKMDRNGNLEKMAKAK